MENTIQQHLLNALIAEYKRVYLLDLKQDRIIYTYNTENELPPLICLADTYTEAHHRFTLRFVDPEHRVWFENNLSCPSVTVHLQRANVFSFLYKARNGKRTRIDVRAALMDGNEPQQALICIPNYDRNEQFFSGETINDFQSEKDFEIYFNSLQTDIAMRNRYEDIISSQSISSYDVDLTDNVVLTGDFKRSDLLYHAHGIRIPGRFDLIRETWAKRITSDNVEEFKSFSTRENLLKMFEEGQKEAWIEYRVQDLSGMDVWFRETIVMNKDEKDGHIRAIIIFRDITDRKKMELEHQRRLDVINGLSLEYDSVYFVDLIHDTFSIYRISNEVYEVIKDCILPEFSLSMSRFANKVVYSNDYKQFMELTTIDSIRDRIKESSTYSFTFRVDTKRGILYYRCKVVGIGDPHKECKEALVGFADVTEEHENELRQRFLLENALDAAEQSGRAKTAFLSNLSHDIRTPMNAILGYAHLAQFHIDDKEEVLQCINKIEHSGAHLLQMLNNSLDLSRIESGRMNLNETSSNLKEMMDTVINMVDGDMNYKSQTLNVEFDESLNQNVYCDRVRYMQVMINLLENAVKYTPYGGHILFSMKRLDGAPNGYLKVEMKIKDDGIGMSEQFLSKIYEPFEREESEMVTQINGNGLGLSICKGIVDQMGGDIRVYSAKHKGTTFKVTIAMRQDDTQLSQQDKVLYSATSRFRIFSRTSLYIRKTITHKPSILLVEDNDLNRDIGVRLLQREGLKVFTAANGQEAVNMVKNNKKGAFDLVLMDIRMPILNGYEATKQIKAYCYKRQEELPIIALSADAFDESVKEAKDTGMDAFAIKPIDTAVLMEIINHFLEYKGDEDDGM
ncbi:MAG: response regulator [Faecalicoccus sp.]|nr:response regulator [Faecalicoccus sp.]